MTSDLASALEVC